MKRAVVIGWIVVGQWIAARGLDAQGPLPETPAAKMCAQFFEAVNNDLDFQSDFWTAAFADGAAPAVQRRKSQTGRLRSEFGQLSIQKVLRSSPDSITVECTTTSGPVVQVTINVSDQSPDQIASIGLEVGGSGPLDDRPLDDAARRSAIETLAQELRAKYVFPDVGENMAAAAESSLQNGEYDELSDARRFAERLSTQLGAICKDKHFGVRAQTMDAAKRAPGIRSPDNHGFVKVESMPGGVGYLKFNFFSGDPAAEETAAAAMNFLAGSKALIFDLRENGGGSPQMIAFLSTYLFPEKVHLNSFYNRPTDEVTETWTRDEVPGRRFDPDVPVYVLTSAFTFSGAEEFSYNLKNLKRGVIVGETTGGGAHPVMTVPLGDRLIVQIPFARAINPITKTNWEGTGVEPDIQVASEEALDRALELARAQIQETDTAPQASRVP
jgi:hypothetical protein